MIDYLERIVELLEEINMKLENNKPKVMITKGRRVSPIRPIQVKIR